MANTLKIGTTTIKAVSLFFLMSLALACPENKNSTPNEAATTPTAASTEKSPESTTITGTVKAITFGKDGYTADVQTDKEGSYAALVSIVNVGGRENYKTCDVGDRVTYEGNFSVLGDARQLKVTKIINITPAQASGQNEDVTALGAQYNKIKPEDYCWQANKVIELHTQPSTDSKVEGKHFAGEILKVLGTKVINNQLWVNVKYTFKIKAGYEDQFADGQVTPSGLPTGWIGGAETPKINCK